MRPKVTASSSSRLAPTSSRCPLPSLDWLPLRPDAPSLHPIGYTRWYSTPKVLSTSQRMRPK
eukprot:483220-Pyramimonas_sp.AAC.1